MHGCKPEVLIRNSEYQDGSFKITHAIPDMMTVLDTVTQLRICSGAGSFNMLADTEEGFRCGNTWISNTCSLINDGRVCESCLQLRSKLKKKCDSLMRGNPKTCNGKSFIIKKRNASIRQKLRRNHVAVSTLRTSLKVLTFKFKELKLQQL